MSKRTGPRATEKTRSLCELVGTFLRNDARANALEERAANCRFAARASFPKRPKCLMTSYMAPSDKLTPLTADALKATYDNNVSIFPRSSSALRRLGMKYTTTLTKLRAAEATENAILERAGYFKLIAAYEAAEASSDRLIEQILSRPVSQWGDVAAMLRFMGRWEPFASARGDGNDITVRTYRALSAGVRRKLKR